MAIEKVREYLASFGAEDKIREFDVSSATVELAAAALGCDGARIAKTMSFETPDGDILIVAAGDVIDLKDFEVKGYKVTLTTLDGDRCIGGYIVPDKDVTLVITYEKLEKGGFPWYLVAIGGALATGGVVAVLLLKKKGGVKNEK